MLLCEIGSGRVQPHAWRNRLFCLKKSNNSKRNLKFVIATPSLIRIVNYIWWTHRFQASALRFEVDCLILSTLSCSCWRPRAKLLRQGARSFLGDAHAREHKNPFWVFQQCPEWASRSGLVWIDKLHLRTVEGQTLFDQWPLSPSRLTGQTSAGHPNIQQVLGIRT